MQKHKAVARAPSSTRSDSCSGVFLYVSQFFDDLIGLGDLDVAPIEYAATLIPPVCLRVVVTVCCNVVLLHCSPGTAG